MRPEDPSPSVPKNHPKKAWFARAAWLDACESDWLFAEQHALRSHRDLTEMTAAITERFADDGQPCLAEPFAKIDS